MSLYHEAAGILTTTQKDGGALKSLIFSRKDWKSNAKALFALTTEAAKWSQVLSEVIEKSGILKLEKNLTPTLALLLTHDLFLSKKGIALPTTHGLNATISRHKVRLSAELTKARLRRGFATLDALREHINSESANGSASGTNGEARTRHPRWIRINTIKTTLDTELETTFKDYWRTKLLQDITLASPKDKVLHIDSHVPNLVAIATSENLSAFKSYKDGKLIFQEKASCFPAYLLNPNPEEGDVIDACAAPGNKTTHLAAILSEASGIRITACEKDIERSKTLEKMVKLAGADNIVHIHQMQNFLKLNPSAKDFARVTSLLLDPSCSGSGIFGRDEGNITVRLPSTVSSDPASKGKKRKRGTQQQQKHGSEPTTGTIEEEVVDDEPSDQGRLRARLENLSTFQLRLLRHAMQFPSAKRITYSTCSIHAEENEYVVMKALLSDVALKTGWKILKRRDQIDGMQRWHRRGVPGAVLEALKETEADAERKQNIDVEELADACIRCEKGGEDGTMGFFVAGFVRDELSLVALKSDHEVKEAAEEKEEEWDGFSSDDG